MGGGAVFRSVVRLISASTAAAVSHLPPAQTFRSVPCGAVFESGEWISPHRNLSHVVNTTQSSVANLDAESIDPEGSSLSKAQLVFSSPPTAEEVEDATRDLHAALRLSLPASGPVPQALFVAAHEDYDDVISEKQVMTMTTSGFEAFEELGESKNNVMEAFLLLKRNPKVQDVVKSLASDPAVWNAMLNNEKLQEFANNQSFMNDKSVDEWEHQETEDFSFSKFTSKVYGIVTDKVLNLFHKVMVQLNCVYGSVEKAFLSKGGFSGSDKTVMSCMMLAVAVLLMVFFKRAR